MADTQMPSITAKRVCPIEGCDVEITLESASTDSHLSEDGRALKVNIVFTRKSIAQFEAHLAKHAEGLI